LENSKKEFLVEEATPELPAGVTAIAVVTFFTGFGYAYTGFAGIWSITSPILSFLYLGGRIIMMVIARSLVQLNLWALWGAMAMLAVTVVLILVNPFVPLQVPDNPLERIFGAVVFFLLICYLGLSSVRSKFIRPDGFGL
jgi:hypothetical protein